ncbi:MAG: adenosylcobinamide-GDP ribazoletransferase [Dysosmobacter welbionis]
MLILETAAVAFSMLGAAGAAACLEPAEHALCHVRLFPGGAGAGGTVVVLGGCCRLALPELLRGAGLCLLPVVVTGGIHLDGYADTSDALASAPRRRREIYQFSLRCLCHHSPVHLFRGVFCALYRCGSHGTGCIVYGTVLRLSGPCRGCHHGLSAGQGHGAGPCVCFRRPPGAGANHPGGVLLTGC